MSEIESSSNESEQCSLNLKLKDDDDDDDYQAVMQDHEKGLHNGNTYSEGQTLQTDSVSTF